MATAAVNVERVRGMYRELVNPKKEFTDARLNAALNTAWDAQVADKVGDQLGKEQFIGAFKLMRSVAQQISEDEFVAWQTEGTLPPVKLSPAQMEALHGGIIISVTVGIIVVIAGGIYYYW